MKKLMMDGNAAAGASCRFRASRGCCLYARLRPWLFTRDLHSGGAGAQGLRFVASVVITLTAFSELHPSSQSRSAIAYHSKRAEEANRNPVALSQSAFAPRSLFP
jgi:hypothetical protein